MGMFTAIPKDTFDMLQMDAGVILTGFDITKAGETDLTGADAGAEGKPKIVCATTGGITVSCVPTFSDLGEDIDNCPNNTLELKHLDSWECTMSFTALGTSAEAIKFALAAADIGDISTPEKGKNGKITLRSDLKNVKPTGENQADTDYSDIWWVGDRTDGGMVAVCLKNALSTSGFSLKTEKNGKGQVTVELMGHYSITDQKTVPMEFYSVSKEELEKLKSGE